MGSSSGDMFSQQFLKFTLRYNIQTEQNMGIGKKIQLRQAFFHTVEAIAWVRARARGRAHEHMRVYSELSFQYRC